MFGCMVTQLAWYGVKESKPNLNVHQLITGPLYEVQYSNSFSCASACLWCQKWCYPPAAILITPWGRHLATSIVHHWLDRHPVVLTSGALRVWRDICWGSTAQLVSICLSPMDRHTTTCVITDLWHSQWVKHGRSPKKLNFQQHTFSSLDTAFILSITKPCVVHGHRLH